MASADYRLCDLCGSKAFYDSNLNYEFNAPVNECIRGSPYKVDCLGDWSVLCRDCAKTHRCTIEPIEPKNPQG